MCFASSPPQVWVNLLGPLYGSPEQLHKMHHGHTQKRSSNMQCKPQFVHTLLPVMQRCRRVMQMRFASSPPQAWVTFLGPLYGTPKLLHQMHRGHMLKGGSDVSLDLHAHKQTYAHGCQAPACCTEAARWKEAAMSAFTCVRTSEGKHAGRVTITRQV
eukprot:1136973-Pelagomonas_calceolata.AAC.8